jgi:hypothetical protein
VTSLADALATAQEDANGSYLYFGQWSSGVTLSGVHLADLTAANFHFAASAT